MLTRHRFALVATAALLGLSACATAPSEPPVEPAQSGTRAMLDSLEVKGRAPKTGYDRAEFGQAWFDDVAVEGGHNGCDTRNDILRRDLVDVTIKPGTRGCVVAAGTLEDAYSGETVDFVRGETTSPLVQIDHVVALSDAWQKGAQQLDVARRTEFANADFRVSQFDTTDYPQTLVRAAPLQTHPHRYCV